MSGAPNGRSLELFFIDGRPDGMLTAEVFNWTGHVLMAPRVQIMDALKRKEARYTGVYLLIGERDGEPLAYVGEAEDIAERIRNHDARKDWWTSAVLVTTAANALNKAHVKYLEARLIELARAVGRVALDNQATPARPGLSEAAQANMESFLDYLLLVLPALRIDLFLSRSRSPKSDRETARSEPLARFELVNRKHGLSAMAVVEGGEFVVQAGSAARKDWAGRGSSANTSYAALHAELTRSGVLRLDGGRCMFATDYAFKSPSAAAAVVNGRTANGTVEWKLKGDGRTYKDWEAEQLARGVEGPA